VPGADGEEIQYRITQSEDDPIDLRDEAMPCFFWLMERYGLRPTQPSSASPNGSNTPTDDTSSTDGASPTESSNEPSLSPTG